MPPLSYVTLGPKNRDHRDPRPSSRSAITMDNGVAGRGQVLPAVPSRSRRAAVAPTGCRRSANSPTVRLPPSRVNDTGDITATIDNRKVAAIRLRLDAPTSAYFSHPATGLRVDLLFDFPVAAAQLAGRARRLTVQSRSLLVASEDDLLHLKQIARANRTAPGDAEDIVFLEARRDRR